MAVFRIEKTKDYTVMSNHHLRNRSLSLKAKGLLSVMLSLPEDWDYTTKGLAQICRDGIDAISAAVHELESAGYVVRERVRNKKGQMGAVIYTIRETPITSPDGECLPITEKPKRENPILDNPRQVKPKQENPAQLNTNISNTKELNTDKQNTHSFPSSDRCDSVIDALAEKRREGEERDAECYREIIKENLEYEALVIDLPTHRDKLNEILELIVETVCSNRKFIRIGGEDYPSEIVRSRFMKLEAEHIKFVFECLERNTTEIRNIKQYLIATLFNAPITMESYYSARVSHDLYAGK